MTNATVKTTNDYIKVTLPSGLKAQVLKDLKGKHQRLAGRVAAAELGDNFSSDDPEASRFALVSVACKVDGKALSFNDVEELSLQDIRSLEWTLFTGKKSQE